MIGQFSDTEFKQLLARVGWLRSNVNYEYNIAWIITGNTTNYYKQEVDGSWTNYDCKTKY